MRSWHEKRRDLTRAARDQCVMRRLNQRQTADSGADADAYLFARFLVKINAGVLQRINSRGESIVDEGVKAASFLRSKPLRHFEIFDLAGNLRRQTAGIEAVDAGDAGSPGNNIAPSFADTDSNGRYDAQTGNDYFSSCQWSSVT